MQVWYLYSRLRRLIKQVWQGQPSKAVVPSRYGVFMHNIVKRAPPTLFMLGNKDKLLPVATGKAYQKKTQEVGSECELIIYIDKRHGFFNRGESFTQTLIVPSAFINDAIAEINVALHIEVVCELFIRRRT